MANCRGMAPCLLSILAVALVQISCASQEEETAEVKKTERIAIAELKNKLASEEFLLIDVREDSELAEHGAIQGAIHIPMGELDDRMQDIPKDIELVFY